MNLRDLDTAVVKRFLRGVVAQGYGQLITIGLQLATVPVLLAGWGATQYGAWLTLSALPTYLGVADLGFAQVAASEMTMRVAAGDRHEALRIFQSTLVLVGAMVSVLLLATVAAVFTLPIDRWLGLPRAGHTSELVLLLLCGQTALQLLLGIIAAGYRAEGRFAFGVAVGATTRLLEGLGLIIGVLVGGDLVTAAFVMLAIRAVATLYVVVTLRDVVPWLTLGRRFADRRIAISMIGPSMGFMAFVLANMVAIQGTTIVLSSVLGPTAVVVVSTTRTLARLGPTGTNMLHWALQPEYSMFRGAGSHDKMWALFKKHLGVTLALTTAYLVGSGLLAQPVLHLWTGGHVSVPVELLTTMVVGCALEMTWTALQTPLVSISRHKLAGTASLLLSIIGIVSLPALLGLSGVSAVGWVYVGQGAVMLTLCAARLRAVWQEVAA